MDNYIILLEGPIGDFSRWIKRTDSISFLPQFLLVGNLKKSYLQAKLLNQKKILFLKKTNCILEAEILKAKFYVEGHYLFRKNTIS